VARDTSTALETEPVRPALPKRGLRRQARFRILQSRPAV